LQIGGLQIERLIVGLTIGDCRWRLPIADLPIAIADSAAQNTTGEGEKGRIYCSPLLFFSCLFFRDCVFQATAAAARQYPTGPRGPEPARSDRVSADAE
jgi:hypothetical protein